MLIQHDASIGKHCKSPLDLTPIRASSASIKKKGILGDKEVNVMSNRRGSVDLETFFGTKLQVRPFQFLPPAYIHSCSC